LVLRQLRNPGVDSNVASVDLGNALAHQLLGSYRHEV
jgi:hypothetical protein